MIREAWDEGFDGGNIQDLAIKHGLIVPAIYDPEKHGVGMESDPGDEIYIFADWVNTK